MPYIECIRREGLEFSIFFNMKIMAAKDGRA
jgi:hypothetical protein